MMHLPTSSVLLSARTMPTSLDNNPNTPASHPFLNGEGIVVVILLIGLPFLLFLALILCRLRGRPRVRHNPEASPPVVVDVPPPRAEDFVPLPVHKIKPEFHELYLRRRILDDKGTWDGIVALSATPLTFNKREQTRERHLPLHGPPQTSFLYRAFSRKPSGSRSGANSMELTARSSNTLGELEVVITVALPRPRPQFVQGRAHESTCDAIRPKDICIGFTRVHVRSR